MVPYSRPYGRSRRTTKFSTNPFFYKGIAPFLFKLVLKISQIIRDLIRRYNAVENFFLQSTFYTKNVINMLYKLSFSVFKFRNKVIKNQ